MAHYAKLNNDSIVEQVIVISNADEMLNGIEDESAGIAFCQRLTGHQNWKKTSYNNNIRKRYAGIGYRYDPQSDAFIAPQPFASWTIDENQQWVAATPMPNDGKTYSWSEAELNWVERHDGFAQPS